MNISARVVGFSLLDNDPTTAKAEVRYDDGQSDHIRMSLADARQLTGERIEIFFKAPGQVLAIGAAPTTEEAPKKRGRKKGTKNKSKLLDLSGNEIKNAAGKTFKNQGIYSAEDARAILQAISEGKHKVDDKLRFRLVWLTERRLSEQDANKRTFTEALAAHTGNNASRQTTVIDTDESQLSEDENKGNKRKHVK